MIDYKVNNTAFRHICQALSDQNEKKNSECSSDKIARPSLSPK